MSKISLKPNDSGTGTFTLEAPNSNTNRTLSLPDEAGTVLTNVSDIESQVKTATNATGTAPVYACRAWVNFDGTGTVSIRASGNVSSITDNGTGLYTVNFATAMEDDDYSVVFGTGKVSYFGISTATATCRFDSAPSISSIQVRTVGTGNNTNPVDIEYVNISIFR